MTTSSFLQETQPTLTLKDVVLSRQNSFLSWATQDFREGFFGRKMDQQFSGTMGHGR